MTDLRAAAQQALEALELAYAGADVITVHGKAITALRAALAEPTVKDSLQVESAFAENATTQQQLEEAPPSDYRRGYWDGFEIGKREGRIEAENALAEPVQEPDSPERRCGGPGCDMRCCQPVQEPVLQALADADRVMGHDDEATEWRERWKHLFGVAGSATSPWRESAAQGCSPGGTGMPASPPQRPAEPVQETSAERTLKRMGYTDCGGQFWKPPLGTPAQPQEPVGAVLVNRESREGVMFYSVDMIPDPSTLKDRFELVPVYTAPPQRLPLAEWQINDLMADIDPEDRDSWAFRQGVYAAEKHHGVRK